jgi:predicted O-methyltransferase YrrM
MPFDSELLRQTRGFLDPEEGRGLYEYALTAASSGPCLEVGSYCGKSALYLGAACKDAGAVLFSIDHHRGSEEHQPGEAYHDPSLVDERTGRVDTLPHFRATLVRAGLEDTVVPIVARSETAARGWATPLGLVFIDGGHAVEAVSTDYNCWARHVVSGGFLLFHDIFTDPEQGGQAPRQVYCAAIASGMFRELDLIRTLGVLRRVG